MAYINLNLDFKRAQFVEKSKEPKEGFERNDWTFHDRTGTNYRRFTSSVNGVVNSIKEEKVNFGGREQTLMKVALKSSDGNIHTISFNLWGQYGMESDAKTMIGALRGMIKGEIVTITPTENIYKNKKGEDKRAINIYINYDNIKNSDGKSSSTGYIPYSEVPKMIIEEKRGQKVYNSEKIDDFYYDILKDLESKYTYTTSSTGSSSTREESTPTSDSNNLPTASPQDAFETASEFKSEDYDDLPF